MALTLALLEVSSLFVLVCGMLLVGAQPFITDWLDVAAIFGQALAISFSCVLCFYYNDLYDLQITNSYSELSIRLLQSIGAASILLAISHSGRLFPCRFLSAANC